MNPIQMSDEKIDLKNSILEVVSTTLKAEFVGIDPVIDRVVDSLSNWYLFPELQERPVVINLWGMTGVGKTALILRIAELLDFEKKLFRYDMGNNANRNTSLKEILNDLFLNQNGMPAMIMLDEFQYAKTKDEDNRETDNQFSRVIWDLLDSGKFQSFQHKADIPLLTKTKELLDEALQNGVKVEKGIVTENVEPFVEIINFKEGEPFGSDVDFQHMTTVNGKETYQFIPKDVVVELYYCFNKKYSIRKFKNKMMELNGVETIQLFDRAIESAQSNRWVDCTKCVVFVLGNLDEAYTMSSTFNPDINANEFHESSKQININHIKQALRKRFRNEQISRLGNNHIIYPAFNEASFYKLINLELKNIADKYLEQFSLQLTFTDNFIKLIYAEGVFPTQGTRPLFSTIYQMVNAKFPILFSQNILKKLAADKIIFDTEGDKMIYSFYKLGQSLYQFEEKATLHLSRLRKPAKDDMQALVAVHEAGHAVMSIAGLKVIPEYICSTSSDVNSNGITVVKKKWKYFSKEEVVYRIAENLGGIVAEKMIFGADKITRGAGQDIETATQLATNAIKEYGMGSIIAALNTPDPRSKEFLHDLTGDYNNEVKILLEKGTQLAETLLLREKNLLLQLSDHLSDERIIKKKQIEEKIRTYGSDAIKNVTFIENGDHLFYRVKLKNQVFSANNNAVEELVQTGRDTISLNKNQ